MSFRPSREHHRQNISVLVRPIGSDNLANLLIDNTVSSSREVQSYLVCQSSPDEIQITTLKRGLWLTVREEFGELFIVRHIPRSN